MKKYILYAVVAATSTCALESFAMISFVTREGVFHRAECHRVKHQDKETHSGIALFSYTPEGTNTPVSYYAGYQFYNTAAPTIYALVFLPKEANATSVSCYAQYQPYIQDKVHPNVHIYSEQHKDRMDTGDDSSNKNSGCDMSVNSVKTPLYEGIIFQDIVERPASSIYRDAFKYASGKNAAPLPKIDRDVLLNKMQQDNSSHKKDSSLAPASHSAPISALHNDSPLDVRRWNSCDLPKHTNDNYHSINHSEGAIFASRNRSNNANHSAYYYNTSIDPEYGPAPLPIIKNVYTIMPPVNSDSCLSTQSTTSIDEMNASSRTPQENSSSNSVNTDEKKVISRVPLKRFDRKSANKAKNRKSHRKTRYTLSNDVYGYKAKYYRKTKYSTSGYSYSDNSSDSSSSSYFDSCSSSYFDSSSSSYSDSAFGKE
ncbi:hypothetical protein FACS1894122_02940 [Alphaproteobacteria bacterium]|nr:hypothetical protein FACS1894122_02940 [Alphaproteobacteria bacterium]